jgi:hypothetical protein
MSKNKLAQQFVPYAIYLANKEYIDSFLSLTKIAYGITEQLLFKHPREQLLEFELPRGDDPNQESYSMADREVESIELVCGWFTIEEYAEKYGHAPTQVENDAQKGLLDPVLKHPETGKDVIIWPKEMQTLPLPKLPEPGLKKFIVKVKRTEMRTKSIDLDFKDEKTFSEVQRMFLKLAHSLGEPEEVRERAEEDLYRSCFLLQWTIFEVFLRSTIQELIQRHPSKVVASKQSRKASLSYEEVLEMSSYLTSIESLRDRIVQREIERLQSGGASVHGLINFLKDEFHFEDDPYQAWYVLNGEHKTTHYNDLIELKDVRNALIHDAGRPASSFFEKYPSIQRRSNSIIITIDYYHKAVMILSSIAFLIDSRLYLTRKVQCRRWRKVFHLSYVNI